MYGKSIQILVIILLVVAIAACSEHFVTKLSANDEVTEKDDGQQKVELPPIIKVGKIVGCTIITKYEKTSIIIPWFSKLKILKISGNWVYVQRGAETAYKYWMYVPNYIWVEEKGT